MCLKNENIYVYIYIKISQTLFKKFVGAIGSDSNVFNQILIFVEFIWNMNKMLLITKGLDFLQKVIKISGALDTL